MPKRGSLEFIEVSSPITELVTKFGGQPVWYSTPQWPISRSTGNPMRFICQIALDPKLFGKCDARMAYLFMTDEEDYVDATWDPESGENAVIIQPGETLVPVQPLATGPSLFVMTEEGTQSLVRRPCEFAVQMSISEDPEFLAEQQRWKMETHESEQYWNSLQGNKVAGVPGFIQGDDFPGDSYHTLLLQLEDGELPFSVNFGDFGTGYAFLSDDRKSGKFLWQCC